MHNTQQPTTPKADIAPAEAGEIYHCVSRAREGESCAKCGKTFKGKPLVHFSLNPSTNVSQPVCDECACRFGFLMPDNSFYPWWAEPFDRYPIDWCQLKGRRRD